MKILLTNANSGEKQNHLYFPLGLGYIASSLISEGHEVAFFDTQNLSEDEILKQLINHDFDILGISALITDFKYAKWFSDLIKNNFPNKHIILGGGISTIPELILGKSNIDIIVCREGEVTVKKLVKVLSEKGNLNKVEGIAFKTSGEIIKTIPQLPISDLDKIPFPAYDKFNVKKYLQTDKLGFSSPVKSLSILSSRGCPYRCVFCDKGVWGKKYRARSAENIINEIIFLKGEYKVDAIVFSDDLFILNKKRVYDFCDKLIHENIDIAWSCNGRINIVDEDLLKIMKKAGCMTIGYGFESGSQKMLDVMKKDITIDQAKKAIELTRKIGIDIQPYLVLGMVGEDEGTIQETIAFCKEMGLIVGKFGIFTPLPNTELYEIAKKKLNLPDLETQIDHWQDWTEKITINLTNLSDDKLLELKKNAEIEIRSYFLKHHLGIILKRILLLHEKWGFRISLIIVMKWLKKLSYYLKTNNNDQQKK